MRPGMLRNLVAGVLLLAGTAGAASRIDTSLPAPEASTPTPLNREEAGRQLVARREALQAFKAGGVAEGGGGTPFPWLPLGLCLFVLGAAYPFARSYFRETVDEFTGPDR